MEKQEKWENKKKKKNGKTVIWKMEKKGKNRKTEKLFCMGVWYIGQGKGQDQGHLVTSHYWSREDTSVEM